MRAERSRPAANRAADNKLAGDVVEIDSHSTREPDLDIILRDNPFAEGFNAMASFRDILDERVAAPAGPTDFLTEAKFVAHVTQAHLAHVQASGAIPTQEELIRGLLDHTNAECVRANVHRSGPYKPLPHQRNLTPTQIKLVEKTLDIELDPALVVSVTAEPPAPARAPIPTSPIDRTLAQDYDETYGLILDQKELTGPYAAKNLTSYILANYHIGQTEDGEDFAAAKGDVDSWVADPVQSMGRKVRGRLWRDARLTVSKEVLSTALATVESQADAAIPVRLKLRASNEDDLIRIDLGHHDEKFVEITADGWRVIRLADGDRSPHPSKTFWRRSRGTLAMPEPISGGSRDELRELLQMQADDPRWKLIWGWAVGSVFERFARPALWCVGVQGSGKTTVGKLVKNLIEPTPELGKPPTNPRDDLVVATSYFCPSFDNITSITTETSNFFCNLVTGVMNDRRMLYTDEDMVSRSLRRTAVATSLSLPFGLKADALERIVLVEFERMDDTARLTESEMLRRFNEMWPRLLGALYDDVVKVLGAMARVMALKPVLPRMADYAAVLHALDEAEGNYMAPDGFAASYTDLVIGTMAERAIEDPLVSVLLGLVKRPGDTWSGTANELFAAINPKRPAEAGDAWPKGSAALGRALTGLSEPMKAAGLELARVRGNGGRVITITNIAWPPAAVRVDASDDQATAALREEAHREADGYTAHLMTLGVVGRGWVMDMGDGRFSVEHSSEPADLQQWDPATKSYNGQLGRSRAELSVKFRAA